jgi:UDP-3-O-[3-hydroxymyristoyl] glucosamine N-acyltransferase
MKAIKPSSPPTLEQIKSVLGEVEISGTGPDKISFACGLDHPEISEGCLTFLRSFEASKVLQAINSSKASFFLISNKTPTFQIPDNKYIIKSNNPNLDFVRVIEAFFLDREQKFLPQDIHPTAIVDSTARLSKDTRIGAYAIIGANVCIADNVCIHPHAVIYHDVKIGNNCIIHAHSVIREHSDIGNNCIIQAGSVIGADGFGYVLDQQRGQLKLVPQLGSVKLEDNVEVGANTCIDRATAGYTIIGTGTKIDNLVQVGHNVTIGRSSLLCGQVGVGGSTVIGDGVILGGQVGVGDHMNVASSARVGGGSAVTISLDKAGDYTGSPAMPAFGFRRILSAQKQLPELIKKLKRS